MRKVEEIKNVEVREEIEVLSTIFEDSFINHHFEFIALLNFNPHKHSSKIWKKKNCFANLYFSTSSCESKLDVQCKVLEYFSRDCFKTQIDKAWINRLYHKYVLERVNQYLKTNFTEEDMEIIYTYLGNSVNREKTIRFIKSGFDLMLLKE